jgi:hypothetical protein
MKLIYPDHLLPPWPTEDDTRDRSNRMLGVSPAMVSIAASLPANLKMRSELIEKEKINSQISP